MSNYSKPAPETLAQQTAARIGCDILHGTYDGRKFLPVEPDLMIQYDVSRNVLREAVRTLVGKRILYPRRRSGTEIEPVGNWNLLDEDVLRWILNSPNGKPRLLSQLTELRAMIEPDIAKLAARNATSEQKVDLAAAYVDMERFKDDGKKAIVADIKFHEILIRATQNQLLMSLLPAFKLLLRVNFEMSIESHSGFIRNLEEHRQIAEAVDCSDEEMAYDAMLRILRQNESVLNRLIKS